MRTSRWLAGVCVLYALTCCCQSSIYAQVVLGTITGTVTDKSGAIMPNVEVTLTNQETGVVRNTASTSAGVYSILELPAGSYTISANITGFQRITMSGLKLSSAQTLRQDFVMQLGSLTESVEVQATAALISTDTQSIETDFTTKQIAELPQAIQDIDGFFIMEAGVSRATFNSAPQFGGSTHWGADNFTLNGVSVNDPGNGGGAYSYGLGGVNLPALGSLQEVQTTSINMDARSSRVVNVSMITKNGTNHLRGDLYELVENTDFNANSDLLNATGQPRPSFHRNQFGVDVGGPIAKNHTFFFFDYSGLRQITPTSVSMNLPTMAERQGDFSALCATYSGGICAASGGTQLYNPFTGLPFANNQIPSSLITTQAQKVLTYVPAPTNAASLGLPNGSPNYVTAVGSLYHVNKYDARIDQTFSPKDSLFGVFSPSIGKPWFAPLGTPPTYGNGGNYGYNSYALSVTETHTFAANTLNSFRLGWADLESARSGQNSDFNPYSLFSQLTPSNNRGLPNFTMTGYGAVGDIGQVPYTHEYSVEFNDDFTHIVGAHTFMAGVDETGFKVYAPGGAYTPLGSWGFDGSWTGNSGWPGSQHSNGNAFADFLLGTAISAGSGNPAVDKVLYSRDWEFYVQDRWQVNPKLTVNYGVRYVYQTPWATRNNVTAYFDPLNDKIALPEQSTTVTAPPGSMASLLSIYPVETTAAAGLSTSYFKPDKNNIAPRVGLAWRPFASDRTVIRAGYGIYYNYNAAYVGPSQDAQNIPWASNFTYSSLRPKSPTSVYLPDLSFAQPFPTGSQTAPAANPTVYYIDNNATNARVQEWNFTAEHQFSAAWAARLTYVGNQTSDLSFYSWNINIPNVQQLGVPLQKQRPYQPWGTISSEIPSDFSNTSQFQAEVKHQLSNGFQIQFEYSFTHCLDEAAPTGGPQNPSNPRGDYGNCSYLVRQTAVMNYLYELPFGKGKRWLKEGPLSRVLGNWSVAGITSYLTGQPFSVAFQVPSSEVGWWGGRADLVPGVDPYTNNHSHTLGTQWFNPAAFVAPTPGTWGNSPRNMLFGPGFENWDVSVMKDFILPFGENKALQFKADFFNVLNHFNPDSGLQTTIADTRDGGAAIPAAGEITSSAENPRVIQLSLKLSF